MVKEARTNSFMVRDCRIECDNKMETPSLSDNIWKLRNIGKGGNIDQRLQRESNYTVEDLLIRLLRDYDGLKKDVGGDLFASAVGHWEDIFEMIGVHSDTSSQGIIPNIASTRENDMIEPPFGIDDELNVHDLDIEHVPCSNLDPKKMVSNAMSGYSMNDDAETGGTGFMFAETFRNREETIPFDEASTPTSSTYLSHGKSACSPDIHLMEGESSFDDGPHNVEMELFSFPSPATDSGFFFDVDPVPPPCWNDNIEFSCISSDGAKWGWDVLVCVLAYRFSLKRLVARRTRVQENSGYCC